MRSSNAGGSKALRVGLAMACLLGGAAVSPGVSAAAADAVEFRVLATSKTSTMEKELNEAAEAGFQFQSVMGGETAVGGSEVVTVVARSGNAKPRYSYKLLATSKTSTMQKELQQAADAGYDYKSQTVFESAFGGKEVVVIMERDKDAPPREIHFKLVATTRTGTLQKELLEAGAAGYNVVGMTVSKTLIGGKELVAITRRSK